ncbi:translation initiation factor IF-2, chloroplastic [Lathyrus oleraceus]|uniref:Translation initiation factor IF-2, chloroplastic n=1 Tax=Pisum sativum TaxID=3888 RepID=A0A9D4YJ53_PEA|nr:translation initiation factor IF-2, chloroplastic [Pisum sativum]KAI5440546.1 Translation initiation factor IF-2 [Pisum sativum]
MFILVGNVQGTMSSLASPVTLGSFIGASSSHSVVRRVSLSRGNCVKGKKRWHCVSLSVCRYSVTTTDFVADHGNPVSLDSSNNGDTDKGGGGGFGLKPPPRPVLKSSDNDAVLGSGSGLGGSLRNSQGSDNVDERNKVIESLGDVLEKAEKLGNSKLGGERSNGLVNNPVRPEINDKPKDVKPVRPEINDKPKDVKPVGSLQKHTSKTLKSIWRKGDSVASVQKVVKEVVRPNIKSSEVGESLIGGGEKVTSKTRDPQLSLSPLPTLQSRPSIAPPPPPPPPPPIKNAVILKDDKGQGETPVNSKEKKAPILIDKFASKKPAVDPAVARAVPAPSKPGKAPPQGRFNDDFRKKGATSGVGPRRRRVVNKDGNTDEDTRGTARKGRKLNKASRRAVRLQAARDAAPVKVEILEVSDQGMLVEELAYNLAITEGEILGSLYSKGVKPDGVQTLDKDMVKMICKDYEVEVIEADPFKVEELVKRTEILEEDDLDKLKDRPPVITIMGHVDHGKTTLLDYIRKTKVAASEAGGITQGIGAYKVQVPFDGKTLPCVFLDTPGHEAFGAMRARGASVTDIAIIVVAADDGIRPQTKEAIAHAKAAGVPLIIAINKIDKDGASPDRVMQELSSIGLMSEDWGGDIPMVQISALQGENVDDLLETVMLVAELQELKANPDRSAKGTVIEAGLDKSKGPFATFIVQNGTLRRGDIVVCGGAFGKVRALFDDGGKRVDEATPSIPIQVIGLNNVPVAGDVFEVVESLDIAREKAESRVMSLRDERISAKMGDGKVTLSSLASAVSSGKLSGLDLHQLNMILKVDLQGSIEAVKQALQVLPQDNVTLKFLMETTGDVSTSDVDLAAASKAIIFGFNVKAPGSIKSYADNKAVEIRLYKVIYELIDDVRKAMEGLLDSVEDQEAIGSAELRAVFNSGSARVAGCMVTDGKVTKGCGIRVIRKGKVVHVGILDSLRRVKEIVKEVNAGLECGLALEDYDEWEEGDILEAFNTIEKRRTLEEASASMAAAVEGVGA